MRRDEKKRDKKTGIEKREDGLSGVEMKRNGDA